MTSVITEATDEDLLKHATSLKKAANSLFAISDYEGALNGYEKALETLPPTYEYEVAVVRSNMAACLVKLGEWKRVEEEVEKGLEELDAWIKKLAEEKEADIGKPEDVQRIRMKLLLRRAKARTELGGWQALQGAKEDYEALDNMDGLSALDKKTIKAGLKDIEPKLEQTKEKEMADMMGKLKDLGNGILKPFGLSTDNFNMIKDPKTGGYNMSFSQN